ncbi:T9SS type A sorting domain-containing protein [Saprospira grandis]|uniref:T9SS type A sorting domain-containing protein n=1 Tax=Saprospira grandis TaxID=1008 RepID=UPI0022DCE73A|nr:T9SS type A sorting domain-containing protein [Saprospira grandis]WBM75236.1 T9SS type A sorting domain-containing protein [Saprospira grandis]
MKKLYLFFTLLCFANFASAQIQVNAYARVTNIIGNDLQLSQVDEAFDSFEDGEEVLIIQVQDDVIGANIANNSSFGELDQILNAGNFEIAQILFHTESAGTPVSITLQNPLSRPYSTGPNSRLQIVSFPQLGSPNYTTTSDITAKAWDGQTGGVLAFEVPNQLTLAHNISADGLGFRGGAVSRNAYGAFCSSHNVYISSSDEYGAKGEGIYPNTNANYTYAKAKMLNGGGGGGHHNGGGGGGNYTEGGEGGRGYNGGRDVCPVATSVGGQPGIALASQIAPNRVFLGGGGGGGQQNNSRATAGANGGGLIYIKAQEIISPASCSGVSISANGNDAASWTNDGAGGGGAGGSILLSVNSFSINTACPLLVEASGGTGGTSSSSPHGGGGGGGQGVVFYSNTSLITNVSSRTDNGLAGCNNNSSPCNNFAGIPSGINGDGVFDDVLLPLELSYFKAQKQDEKVLLSWGVSASDQTTFFELQRAADGLEFEAIAQIPAQFNQTDYTFLDVEPIKGQSYYRLLQIGENEEKQYSIIQAVYLEQMTNAIQLWPNPAKNELYLASEQVDEITQLELLDLQGRKQTIQYQKENNRLHIQWANLPQGIYFLQIIGEDFYQTKKIQIH